MRAYSSVYPEQLRKSSLLNVAYVEIWQNGHYTETLTGTTVGTVNVDKSADNRRRASITLVDDTGDLTPASARDLLAPAGTEFKVFKGLRYLNGVQEVFSQGVFGITLSQVNESAGLQIRLDGVDRSRKVQREKFNDIYYIPEGTNYADAILNIVSLKIPWADFRFDYFPYTAPGGLVYLIGDDPWKTCTDIAASMGADLFFDADGACVLRAQVNPTFAEVVWEYKYGEDALILAAERTMTGESPNDIIFVGNHPNLVSPVLGRALDDDPSSPTYIGGPYGDVVEKITDDKIGSQAQANDAAAGRLASVRGVMEKINFPLITNAAHEEDDAIHIVAEKSKIDSLYLIDSMSIGLEAAQSMNIVTRVKLLT